MRVAALAIFAIALGCTGTEMNSPPVRGAQEGGASTASRGAASAVMPPNAKAPKFAPFREGIELSVSESGLENGLFSDRFNFAQLRELWVRIKVAGMGHTTVIRLTLTTPTGSTFYESNVAYSPDPANNVMIVPNAPHPITVFPAKAMSGGHALVYVVPVAGTALSRYPIPGRWRVDAAIDGGRVLSTEIEVSFSS